MAGLRRYRASWQALIVAVVALLTAAGVAVAATGSLAPWEDGPSAVATAGLGGHGELPNPSEATVTTVTMTSTTVDQPSSTTTTAKPAPSTSSTRPTVSAPLAAVPTTVAAPALSSTTTRVAPPPAGPPKATQSSWTVEDNGIVLSLEIEPAAPRVGDSVTIVFGSRTTFAEDCCLEKVYVDGTQIFKADPVPGLCPRVNITTVRRVTFVATHAGTLDLHLESKPISFCSAQPRYTTSNLYATPSVLPAA